MNVTVRMRMTIRVNMIASIKIRIRMRIGKTVRRRIRAIYMQLGNGRSTGFTSITKRKKLSKSD